MGSRNQRRGTVGQRPRSERFGISDADVARIKHAFQEHPTKSLRIFSAEVGTPFSTIQMVLHEELGMFRYKTSFLKPLLLDDYPHRLMYAQRIRRDLRNDPGYVDHVLFPDDCVFHINGVVKKHNARVWGQEKPPTIVAVPHI